LGVIVEEALVGIDGADLRRRLRERRGGRLRDGPRLGALLDEALERAIRAAVGREHDGTGRLDVLAGVAPGQVGESVERLVTGAPEALEQPLAELAACGPMRATRLSSRPVSREGLKIRSSARSAS
jgi:hypothetical protein